MKWWHLLIICVALHGDKASGLISCWRCENARSEKECIEKGYEQQCRFTETVCQTEVRYSVGWGKKPMIRTSCKEAHACHDNFVQNPRSAWGPTQCNEGRFNSVCRCCCNETLCNRGNLMCERPAQPTTTLGPTTIGPRDLPRQSSVPVEETCRRLPRVSSRGKVTCTNTMLLSSRCTFTCDEGYELVGRNTTVCVKVPPLRRPRWNRRSPICRQKVEKCRPVSTPTNGGVTCSSLTRVVGTVCTFSCNSGHVLKGAPATTCVKISSTPQWDRETPSCIGVCDPMNAPENGRVDCTGSNEVGRATCVFQCNDGYRLEGFAATSCIDTTKGPEWSRDAPVCQGVCDPISAPENGRIDCTGSNLVDIASCEFRCNIGYQLVGSRTTFCTQVFGVPRWSPEVPTCRGVCDTVNAPENGRVDCTGENEVDVANCAFSCNEGYQLVGSTTTSCVDTTQGPEWSNGVPLCRGVCDLVNAPENGRVDCTGENEVGIANCVFSCNDGYRLVGSTTTSCIDTSEGPEWSGDVPSCRGVCDLLNAPDNGRIDCTGENEVGIANCAFSCNDGYQLVGSRTTSCVDTTKGPEWSNDVPSCRGVCDSVNAPENGRVDCTGDNEVGVGNCVFSCNDGYQLVGSRTTSCIDITEGPEWSHDVPTCRGVCNSISEPDNGRVECTSNEVDVGTCTFRCNDGFRLTGSETSSCVDTTNGPEWNRDVPICTAVCDPISAPENGRVDCTGANEVDVAECVFSCNDGFQLAGFETTSCIDTTKGPEWSRDVPQCTDPPPCPALGDLRNGQITCSEVGNEIGTTCSFQCTTEGYELLPSDRLSTECEAAPNGVSKWSKLKPCCNAQCPPMAKRDIVIVVDSSGSITRPEWAAMQSFLVDVVRTFEISDDAVRIAAFRFNRRVDTRSQVLFGDYNTKEELVSAVQKIPKNGGGTYIGQALRHARDNVLTVNNRPNVTDMVFVMTDGRSDDKFKEIAKELRDSGVQIVALGIFKNRRDQILPELIEMTGHEDLVLEVKDVIEGVQNDLVDLVVDKICEVSCE